MIGCDATAILALTKKIIPTNEKGVIELVLLSILVRVGIDGFLQEESCDPIFILFVTSFYLRA